MNKRKILICGEFPPATITGISVSNQQISNLLKNEEFVVDYIEENTWNKNIIGKCLQLFQIHIKVLGKSLFQRYDIFYYNIPLSVFGLLKDIFLILPFSLFSNKNITIGHIHRGDIKDFVNNNRLKRFLFRFVLKRSRKIIVLSDSLMRDLDSFYQHPNILILPNTSAIESKSFVPREYGRKFICIANYIRTKGISDLVACFSDDDMKDYKLSLFGNVYDQDFFDDLERQASNNIQFNKAVKRDEIKETLQAFDALILPSWNEGQPIILLEAMSIGIPVITTDVGDIPDMLGVDYPYVAKSQNKRSLKEAVQRFNQNKEKKRISEYLFQRYHAKYSNDNYQKKVLNIFKSVE